MDLSTGVKYLTTNNIGLAAMAGLRHEHRNESPLNNEVRIQVEMPNHFLEDSIIEIMILRFPKLIEDIFKELDEKSLANCKIASKSWCDFIDNKKFPIVRKLQEYKRNMEEFRIHWNKVVIRKPFEIIKELAIAVHQCFRWSITFKGGKKQWSPLHIAAERGNLQLCKYIVKITGDNNPSRKDGLTPLHLAAGKGHFEVCSFIMENLEDKNPGNKRGKTPFHVAAETGHLSICKLIIQSIDEKNPIDKYGITPFHIAAELGYFEICQLITENIEVKNPTTIEGLTPLHLAALNGRFDVCNLIIDYGVDKHPNFADSTPLQLAARKSHFRVCKLFIDSPAHFSIFFRELCLANWQHMLFICYCLVLFTFFAIIIVSPLVGI